MGEFRRSCSKVWWSHYPEDEDDEVPSSPPLLLGWGPGVSLSSDRGSPSNGSHKSQDSGFSDSEGSSPGSKPTDVKPKEDEEEEEVEEKPERLVHPGLLPETPIARIPRVCLSRYRDKAKKSKQGCCKFNKTFSAFSPLQLEINNFDKLNLSCDNVSTNLPFSIPEKLDEGEDRTCFSHLEENILQNETVPNKSENSTTEVDIVNIEEHNESSGEVSQSSTVSSEPTENETARFVGHLKPPSLPGSPLTKRVSLSVPSSPSNKRHSLSLPASPTATHRPPLESSWTCGSAADRSVDYTELPGHPVQCSTPKSVPLMRIQPRGSRVTRRPLIYHKNFESKRHEEKDPPVKRWYEELKTLYEPECMTTLQSKSLTADLNRQVTVMTAITTESVRALQHRTKVISTEFTKLYRQVESQQFNHVGPLVQSLVGHINEFLALSKDAHVDYTNLIASSAQLKDISSKQILDHPLLSARITDLGKCFTRLVDDLLANQIKVLVNVLEEPASNLALLSALSSLTGLGLEGPHLGQLMCQCSGIRALLTVCIDSRCLSVRTAALRTLALVCSCTQAIRQFEKAGGVEILTEILTDEKRPEAELMEATSVLAQITAPWVEDNHSVEGLTQQLTPLVSALTRLVNNTTSSSTLLLSAAALCHLSLLEPQCVWALLECSTAGTLLQAVRRQRPYPSVFLQEQAAGLLANMAAVPEARPHLAKHRAVVALLCFLQVRHSPLQRAPEIAAAERLQHKSAIALSRLCSDASVADQVVELQGVCRLVRLCKEERERNHSDGVLVACLAALRKITANCGDKVIKELNATELVEPRLLDSFLIYSSKQESYV